MECQLQKLKAERMAEVEKVLEENMSRLYYRTLSLVLTTMSEGIGKVGMEMMKSVYR